MRPYASGLTMAGERKRRKKNPCYEKWHYLRGCRQGVVSNQNYRSTPGKLLVNLPLHVEEHDSERSVGDASEEDPSSFDGDMSNLGKCFCEPVMAFKKRLQKSLRA